MNESEEQLFTHDDEAITEELHSRRRRTRPLHDTAPRKERVILVGVSRPPSQMRYETDDHLDELELLTETAGAEVVEKVYQNKPDIDPSMFIGKGKAEYLRDRCEEADVQTVIFDDDLSPMQQRNLERFINRKIIDRTVLILDIFAQHARTNTAKTQVELAQLEYILPRLTRMWTHLSKQFGGIRTKGPGETQIETDRRIVRDRISHLKAKLARIDRQRATQRKGREDITRISLVGYTNVGKSTLLNTLTGASVLAEDKLFATLDSTVRAMEIDHRTVLLSDTVGFIRKLPSKLVASFKSTLDEVTESDIILHVVDASHPAFPEQIDVVNATLHDIHADGKKTILVFNKLDALKEGTSVVALKERYPGAVFISAERGINLGELKDVIRKTIEERHVKRTFVISPPDFKLQSEFHRVSNVIHEVFDQERITITCEIETDEASRLLKMHPSYVAEISG